MQNPLKLLLCLAIIVIASLVGIVVGGVALTYTLRTLELSNKGIRTVASANDLEDARRAVSIQVGNLENCNQIFQGKSVNLKSDSASLEGIKILGKNGKSILPENTNPNEVSFSLALTNFREMPSSKSGAEKYLASIQIRAEQRDQLTRVRHVTVGVEGAKSGSVLQINNCFDSQSGGSGNPTSLTCPDGEVLSGIDFETRAITCVAQSGGSGTPTPTPTTRPRNTNTPTPTPNTKPICEFVRKSGSFFTGKETSVTVTLRAANVATLWAEGRDFGAVGTDIKTFDLPAQVKWNKMPNGAQGSFRLTVAGNATEADGSSKICSADLSEVVDGYWDLPRCEISAAVSNNQITYTMINTNSSAHAIPVAATINGISVTPPNNQGGPNSVSITETKSTSVGGTGYFRNRFGDTYTCTTGASPN